VVGSQDLQDFSRFWFQKWDVILGKFLAYKSYKNKKLKG